MRKEFHPTLNVALVPVNSIGRATTAKLEQFVSLVAV